MKNDKYVKTHYVYSSMAFSSIWYTAMSQYLLKLQPKKTLTGCELTLALYLF